MAEIKKLSLFVILSEHYAGTMAAAVIANLQAEKYIYLYKVVIYVCLFVWPIISQEPLNRFASNLNWGELCRTTSLAWLKRFKLNRLTLKVNFLSKESWVPKLV